MCTMFRAALIVAFATCVTLGTARVTARDYTFAMLNATGSIDSRFSDNILEDSFLDVPALIAKYNYPIEVHTVTTSDGYILDMHRIPYGRDKNNVADKNKPLVFVMHGLFCSSAIWVLAGPGSGLAYILAEEGYDVWMGNARGTTYSRRHVYLNPDAILNTAYWQFSWDEMGRFDLPSMIDYALNYTGKERLHYVGHSQGTTSFFVMGSLRPEYNEKIISMQALAPVAYMAHNTSPLLWSIAPFANDIQRVANVLGIGEFLPEKEIYTWAGQAFCRDQVVTQSICSNILFLVGGWDEQQNNATILPIIYGHCPAGCSVRQVVHYAQEVNSKEFRRFDHGTWLGNWKEYRSIRPPRYDLAKVTAPVFLHYGDNDPFADVRDVETLYQQLGNPAGLYRVPYDSFTHIDFMWAIDVVELLYNRVLSLIAATEADAA